MRLFIITDVIHAGGAETFVLRLAQALHQREHNVVLFILRKNKIDLHLKNCIAPDIVLESPAIPFFYFWSKLDSLLFFFGIDLSFLNTFYARALRKAMQVHKTELLHAHLFTSDLIALRAAGTCLPVVTTMHGDYLSYSKDPNTLSISRLKSFPQKLKKALQSLGAVVCITNEQVVQLQDLKKVHHASVPVYKIYNGYAPITLTQTVTRRKIGLPEDAFVIGMVARGIREKGWKELAEAFLKLNIPCSYLLMVGDGPFIQKIKQQYQQKNIMFIGAVSNPVDYIHLFDIACLPSYYAAESLPTVIIEYLYCGKPVIATRKAEIPSMLQVDSTNNCGLVFDIDTPEKMIESLQCAIHRLYTQPELYNRLKQNARKAFLTFEMDKCVQQYEQIYIKTLAAHDK
jgi:glycosyltransferase involved in cell wall biosynthesis